MTSNKKQINEVFKLMDIETEEKRRQFKKFSPEAKDDDSISKINFIEVDTGSDINEEN